LSRRQGEIYADAAILLYLRWLTVLNAAFGVNKLVTANEKDKGDNMGIIDKIKKAGNAIATAAIQPLLEKPKKRITWRAYRKWRTLVNNDGQVSLRRYNKQPHDAYVVRSSLEAIDKAWAIEIDSRGRTLPPVVAAPLLPRQPLYPETYRPMRITVPRKRITPRTPRLRR
jgi:hypothetical protein